MSKYYYNGVLLPEIPADVLVEYPYVWIRKNTTSGHYELLSSTSKWHFKDGYLNQVDNLLRFPKYIIPISSANEQTEWEFEREVGGQWTVNATSMLLQWSNHDIPNGSATATDIYFYGSEPVDSNEPEEPDVFYKVNGNRLTEIANAIRAKTGKEDTMTLAQMVAEIESITGSLIAGTGGSGSALQFANGSFNTGTTGVERVTITHGKNVMPDFIAVWKTGITTMDASTRPFMSAWGMKSKFASGTQAAVCCAGYAMAENDNGIDKATESQQNSGYIFCPNETTFQVGRVDSGNGQFLFVPNSAYNWIAIYGIGSGSASGGGVPEDFATVTFMNGAEELFSRPVYIGDDCPDPVTQNRCDEPTKASTVQYTYDHNGWGAADGGEVDSTILQNITVDKTVYAIYKEALRKYTITYLDDDGVTVLKTEQVAYGTKPSYAPEKAGFKLAGWTPSIVAVTGDATYTAQWDEVIGGSCGASATWELNDAGVLTISGTGAMADYGSAADQPWAAYRNDIKTINVNSGITHIGNSAFRNCSNAEKLTMYGGTVTTIGYYALAGCSKLKSAGTVVYYGTATDWKGTSGSNTQTLSKSNFTSLGSYYWGLYKIATEYSSYKFTRQ